MLRLVVTLSALVLLASPARAQPTGNLLRNSDFQDDWLTLLPELKNHHWCYSSEFYHRRDFNPDGWTCKGAWQWLDADKPAGQRRLLLNGPGELVQRVNWAAVHDEQNRGGFPDAGGFPTLAAVRSPVPTRVVRDLTFRVRLKGQDVPADAGSIEVGLCLPGGVDSDPFGSQVPPTARASIVLPTGSFDWRWIEVKLLAKAWRLAAQDAGAKDPKQKVDPKTGVLLPGTARVAILYKAKTGKVEIERAELLEPGPGSSNLLPNGDFEMLDDKGYPQGWSAPAKYRYFPPLHYYIFNTWHNANYENRGPVNADPLVVHDGKRSLKMIVAAGDEKAVTSAPIVLNQKEPRLIEALAWVKTDKLCMLQIDAVDENGRRLDCFSFINKSPMSIGSDDRRLVRQVFRPKQPLKSIRLMLCARGVNGYTLGGVGPQPQNSVVGTIWWDGVRVHEPESTTEELSARGCKAVANPVAANMPYFDSLDLGERMIGDNVLTATLVNPGPAAQLQLQWEFTSPSGKESKLLAPRVEITANSVTTHRVPYALAESCANAYTEYRGKLTMVIGKQEVASEIWFGTWTTPIDLKLGALYLRPDQKQLLRMNLGLSAATLAKLAKVRVEVIHRGTGKAIKTADLPATAAILNAQRDKIPTDLRDDFSNLLLADLDVSELPVQPFADPQRNFLIRATALSSDGKELARVESQPFCRLANEAPQAPIKSVAIKDGLVHLNDKPWLPWGVTYGHNPVYAGPADPGVGKYRDLRNLPAWGIYDRHGGESTSRKKNDFNCLRYVAGSITDPKVVEKRWHDDNLHCSTAFAVPQPLWSLQELTKAAGGKDKLDAWLAWCKSSPAVVSSTPGLEEAFGLFHSVTAQQREGMKTVVNYLRQQTGKPVMVGHGGYWNRFEYERVPFFDIYDPETEPLYPANLHTDLSPLLKANQAMWLRPQMYESIPYERWRFHVYVELMRGARGWQIAHGPADPTLFRGLHGEMEFFKPIVASKDPGPEVRIEPWIEHWSRKHDGKTYVIAATTRGIPFGKWRDIDDAPDGSKRSRLTGNGHEQRDETNAYAIAGPEYRGPSVHGIQYLPDARSCSKGSKLLQWVKLDPKATPGNLVILAKADGRWIHAASWGKIDFTAIRKSPDAAYWFLNSFYRHAKGFLGWGKDLVSAALEYIPNGTVEMGSLPVAGKWIQLEIPLDKLGAAGKLLDGIAFLHEGGKVFWGHTTLIDGEPSRVCERVIWADSVALPQQKLNEVKIHVKGLKAGTKVRVLFEAREIVAQDGCFIDDYRGTDLYQRYGGGWGTGYGDAPVAFHLYAIPTP